MRKRLPASFLFSRQLTLTLLVVLCSAVAAWAVTLMLFTAVYDGSNVRVEWEVSSEADVTGFELARKGAADPAFQLVSSVVPTGQRRYQYLDTNVYRPAAGSPGTSNGALSGGPFTYRLIVRSPSGDQNYSTLLAGTPSAVQRSWGTIKSMFR